MKLKKYLLMKDYDFDLCSFHGGQGVLIIPNNNSVYRPKIFGFGELKLVPYLQDIFNSESMIDVEGLIKKLEEGDKISFGRKDFIAKDMGWFLEKVVNKFDKYNILNVKDMGGEEGLSESDILSKGANYDLTRVYKME